MKLHINLSFFIVLVSTALSFCSVIIMTTFYLRERSINRPFQIFNFPSTYRLPALERSQIWRGLPIDLSPLLKGLLTCLSLK